MRLFRCAGLVAVLGGAIFVSSMSRNVNAADDKADPKWVTVKGKVLWDGPAVDAKKLDVNKDQQHCLSKGPIHSEEIVVNPSNKGMVAPARLRADDVRSATRGGPVLVPLLMPARRTGAESGRRHSRSTPGKAPAAFPGRR